MVRWFILSTFVILASLAGTKVQAASNSSSAGEFATVSRANQLMDEGHPKEAEALYRTVLDRHPDSVPALIFHIAALTSLNRFPEALVEGRKAVALDPENPIAQAWLGIDLVRSKQYREAIPVLEKSNALDREETTSLWLADAYLKNGDKAKADQPFHDVIHGEPDKNGVQTREDIADFFHEVGDAPNAIIWWKQAAALGGKDAARWLGWAYSTGFGVPEDAGDSAYWSRVADDSFPSVPRLPQAAAWIERSGGWILVIALLLSATLFPLLFLGLVGLCVSRGVTTDPAVHWTERARRSYPFQIFLGMGMLFLPVVSAVASTYYPASFLPVQKTPLFWVVLLISLLATNWMTVLLAHRYRAVPGTGLQSLQNAAAILYLYAPVFVIFLIMANVLPSQWNLEAFLIIAATLLAYFWLQFAGWVRLGRFLFLVHPADNELVEMAIHLARQAGQPVPAVWLFRWRKANAFAFPFGNTIMVTERLRALLSREEMKAVLAHELAHLGESIPTKAMRLLTPLLLLPLFTLPLWSTADEWYKPLGCYLLILVTFVLLRKRRRKMEERADALGHQAGEDTTVYSRALAKLYEDNLVPAVMRSKRMVHPHLYDRLLTAGITPDYPRPKRPGAWGVFAALFAAGLHAVALTALWLLLF